MLYEFDTNFSIDTGILGITYTGSGVHLNKDVTCSFHLIDLQNNVIKSDAELLRNTLIGHVIFDILDISGNVVYPNFKSGTTSRSLTISEIDNESIFGQYTKDFGIKSTVSNTVNSNLFVAEFYAYGNTPEIQSVTVIDGTSEYLSAPVYDQVILDVTFENKLQYVSVERFDIYASTESFPIVYPSDFSALANNPYYIYSQAVQNPTQITRISIRPTSLQYDIPYYLTIVPYGSLGYGNPYYIGPVIFKRETVRDTAVIVNANQLEIFNGTESVNTSLITGYIETSDTLIDSIESGIFNTVQYLSQFESPSGEIISTELNISLSVTGASMIEYPINNFGQVSFGLAQSGLFTNLFITPSGGLVSGSYKLYRTAM